jgi:hypothetical protein
MSEENTMSNIEPLPLTLYQIEHRVRRFWRLFLEQQHRGKNYVEARRIAHMKQAPELRRLSDKDRESVLNAIELSE